MQTGKKFVIGLGGSVVFPEEINVAFLRQFYLFIKKEIKKGNKFIIVVGGGTICRVYQKAASDITKVSEQERDWIGIYVTRLNGYLVKTLFGKEAHPVLFDERFKIQEFHNYPIIIGAGWNPGWSTDFVSLQIAVDFKIKQVIMLGKPDYVYTADPAKDKKAEPIEKMSWKDYFKLIPRKWVPGLHVPVDPVAARLAQKENTKVIVAAGKDLDNFKKILKEEKFKGTILSSEADYRQTRP